MGRIVTALLLLVSSSSIRLGLAEAKDTLPNILLIVPGELAYSDVGAFGDGFETPNLDNLAKEGLQLTNFHMLPICSPPPVAKLSNSGMMHVG